MMRLPWDQPLQMSQKRDDQDSSTGRTVTAAPVAPEDPSATEARFRAALGRALSGPYVAPEKSSKSKPPASPAKPRRKRAK